MKTKSNNKGFTLVELIVVIAIIGIIVAIAVPRMGHAVDAAYHATLETNMKNVETVVMLHMIELDDDHIYTYKDSLYSSGQADGDPNFEEEYLSSNLEQYLEALAEGSDYDNDGWGGSDDSNYDAYRNPISGRTVIANCRGMSNEEADWQPAIFLTNRYNYNGNLSRRDASNPRQRFAGTIVVNFNTRPEQIEIYYFDENGDKSDHCTIY